MPATKTEISLDIGSPSFHFVEHTLKVGRFAVDARKNRQSGRSGENGVGFPRYVSKVFSKNNQRDATTLIDLAVHAEMLAATQCDRRLRQQSVTNACQLYNP